MSLVLEGGRIPPRWVERKSSQPVISIDDYNRQEESLKIAFINNMPDPALEDTEMQFFELLNAVADDIPVCLKLYSLPGIPRGDRGRQHLSDFYFNFDDLWNSRFDAICGMNHTGRSWLKFLTGPNVIQYRRSCHV